MIAVKLIVVIQLAVEQQPDIGGDRRADDKPPPGGCHSHVSSSRAHGWHASRVLFVAVSVSWWNQRTYCTGPAQVAGVCCLIDASIPSIDWVRWKSMICNLFSRNLSPRANSGVG